MDVSNQSENEFQRLYPLNDGICGVSDRGKVIDAYLTNRLSEAETDAFESHYFYCSECSTELRLRRTMDDIREEKSHKSWKLPLAAMIALVCLSGLGGRLAYKSALPEHYELKRLAKTELALFESNFRSDQNSLARPASEIEFAEGGQFLLKTEKRKYFIVPYFDRVMADSAISHFQQAYHLTQDEIKKNKYAYFIGRSYFMMSDLAHTNEWLQKTFETNAVVFRQEAKKILGTLDTKEYF